ncbi:MAG: Hsp70 family protein [Okeania sp. SIO2C9]|uniref:Hsp70 family protein n=1 Tax=Okeania sp. SIO2C9 TaxID=2607791 RepID=UPI0013BF3556|nr:Hsp70 family protein [Okeania sp. SIO2C9]NEQ75201.1 Hsp70 family protein [Okeania sp. SIO2C9]
MNSNSENYQIIGFDLGHSKTALASVSSGGKESPEIIEIQKKRFVMTALAYNRRNLPIIGYDAYTNLETSQAKEFEISFKKSPSDEDFSPKLIKKFVTAVYDIVKKSKQLDPVIEKRFFIGHPSGWLQEDVDRYKQLMYDAGLSNIKVVPESRAAFIHAYESKKVTIEQIRKGFLIIDIGSSTTDITFASEKKVEDFGEHRYALGASLIDKEIFKHCCENHKNKDKIDNHFQVNPKDIKKFEIICRKVKEEYFSKSGLYDSGCFPLQEDLYFCPKVNSEIMESILNTKLPDLKNRSWKEAFHEQLIRAKQKFEAKKILPSKILVTGGGARMDFIEEICQKVFPDSHSLYQMDTEPEVCVATGLARWGRLDVKTVDFKEEIDNFLQYNLENIVENNFNNFLDELVDFMVKKILPEIIKPSLIDFRNRKIKTKEELEDVIQARLKEWFYSRDLYEEVTVLLDKYLTDIEGQLTQELNEICQAYRLQPGTLSLEKNQQSRILDKDVLDQIKNYINPEDSVKVAENFPIVALVVSGALTAVMVILEIALPIFLDVITGGLSFVLSGFLINYVLNRFPIYTLSDDKISSILKEKEEELRNKIKDEFSKQQENITSVTRIAIRKAIDEKVDDARILVD